MAGRASIVGAAVTHVGKVRDHNEDAHYFDADAGLFVVCDGMGGHAAGEVASALAVRTVRAKWLDEQVKRLSDAWLAEGTAEARKRLFGVLRGGVVAAHDQILSEGAEDDAKSGMGTTLVSALVVGDELVFAHAGDSRAYLVRDGIAMQLTEDHTLLARLLAAGIDVDVSGEGARFRSMLTNALGIGQECKVATFVVPLADGDRFLLCTDGVSEYVPEAEVGTVLTKQPNPTRAAQQFVDLALARGGGDNATALVLRVLEAGETPQPPEHRRLDDDAIRRCPLWGPKVTPQQRLRALRIAISRDHAAGERIPAHTLGDRVAWILLEGAVSHDGKELGPGALLYPESLISNSPAPEQGALAVARSEVRALALRADDFRELCDDDSELGESLLEMVGALVSGRRRPGRVTRSNTRADTELDRERAPSNSDVIEPPPPVLAPLPITARPTPPSQQAVPDPTQPRPRTAPPHPPPGAPQGARPGSAPPAAVARSTPPKGTSTAVPKETQPGTPSAVARSTPPAGTPTAPARSTPPAGTPAAPARSTPPVGTPAAQAAVARSTPPSGTPAPATAPAPAHRERPPTPAPLPSATSYARAVTPTRSSEPQLQRPSQLSGLQPRVGGPIPPRTITPVTDPQMPAFLLDGPSRIAPPLLPGQATEVDREIDHDEDPTDDRIPDHADDRLDELLEARLAERADSEPGTSPRLKRAPSEPEIETFYEMDAEPPPLPDPEEDNDDPIVEVIVSASDGDEGDEGDDGTLATTEKVTDNLEGTLTLVVTEPNHDLFEDETIMSKPLTAEDGSSVSGTISIPESDPAPAARSKR